MSRVSVLAWCGFFVASVLASSAFGQDRSTQLSAAPTSQEAVTSTRDWHYGAYVDVGYIGNFNFPDNQLWRNRATAAHHNQLAPNMGLAYVRKDARIFAMGYGTWLPRRAGFGRVCIWWGRTSRWSDVLRHIHRANMSYLAPVGNGLMITAGLFNSLMGTSRSMPKTTPIIRGRGSRTTRPI